MNATELMTRSPATKLGVLCLIAGIAVVMISGVTGCSRDHEEHAGHAEEDALYACPMLCVPPTDKPGKCPVCGMNLERVDGASADDLGKPTINMSERSRILSKVQTAKVVRDTAISEVRLTGKVEADETRLFHIAARVPGRIDKVAADYTGMKLEKNDPIVALYSPQLLSAQEELLQAKKAADSVLLGAAREKLRLLGLTTDQVKEIETRGKASEHTTYLSPITGTVIHKDATEGAYVKEGTKLYTIADLSNVWVMLEAYETDLSLLREGQTATFTAEAFPGLEFSANVTFIDPVLDETKRTVAVRLEAENKDGLLKPGLFVRATVNAELDSEGRPTDAAAQPSKKPLLVPASAPLITGKRAVVYIAGATDGEYEGREIVLGPRVGEHFVVLEGLAEGERVVVKGNFRIDSALQIMGKPSMMTPAEQEEMSSAGGPQEKCPIMGGPINKEVYADHEGYRVYFCCPGCDAAFEKDADSIIEKMKSQGIVLDRVPKED